MSINKNIFEQFLFEAPEDETPPDMVDNGTPEVPAGAENDEPPDLPDDASFGGSDDVPSGDEPPELSEEDFGTDDFNDEEMDTDNQEDSDSKLNNLGLDDKVSAIMNMNLYQRYLVLLNTIGGQLTMIKNNSDILYTLSNESLDIVEQLKKLDENIRLYLKNSFVNENYSKNLLFFNKCLNLLKLLNDVFDSNIKKGLNATK